MALHELDIRGTRAAELVEAGGYEVLIHHAAQMDVRRSVADPRLDASVNVIGFLNLMEACRRGSVRKVIFASTGGAIYGEPLHVPQSESHAEQARVSLRHLQAGSREIPAILRPALRHTVRGATLRQCIWPPPESARRGGGRGHLFGPYSCGEQPTINGDGLQTRDYVFVRDVAEANLAALAYPGPSLVCNVGTGRETDVLTLFRRLCALAGADLSEVHGTAKEGEQRRSVLSCDKASRILGWRPRTEIADGLAQTSAWFAARAR